jgi:hypothetical protein
MKQLQEVLGVKIVGSLREASTPWAGASLLVELVCRSGVDAVANKVLPAKGVSQRAQAGANSRQLCLKCCAVRLFMNP